MTNQQTPERPETLVERLEALSAKWRDAAVWEYDDMGNTQSAYTFDQCADELDAVLSSLASRAVPSTGEVEATGRVPSAWSEWGDGHDYSRSGKHDPNECRSCLRHVIKRLEAQPFADRMVQAEARVATLVSLAKWATNGWACYATTPREHDEIAKLHREIDATLKSAAPSEPPAPAASAPQEQHEREYDRLSDRLEAAGLPVLECAEGQSCGSLDAVRALLSRLAPAAPQDEDEIQRVRESRE